MKSFTFKLKDVHYTYKNKYVKKQTSSLLGTKNTLINNKIKLKKKL